MYLRTTKRRNANGTEVRYYQLAENIWDAARGCAVAKVVYDFGRADQVDGEQLRRLARSILRAVDGDVARVKNSVEDGDLRIRDAWAYGGVHVLEALWTELGLDAVVRSHARSKVTASAFERAIFTMVANRALSPVAGAHRLHTTLREGQSGSRTHSTSR